MNLTDIGILMKKTREEHKLTQTQLAHMLGCNQRTVSRIENGDAKSTQFIKMAVNKFCVLFDIEESVTHSSVQTEKKPLTENEATDALWNSFTEDEKAKILLAALRGCQR